MGENILSSRYKYSMLCYIESVNQFNFYKGFKGGWGLSLKRQNSNFERVLCSIVA